MHRSHIDLELSGPAQRYDIYAVLICNRICDVEYLPGLARVSKIKFKYFPDFWSNPGLGCRPLDSDRGDVEFAAVSRL